MGSIMRVTVVVLLVAACGCARTRLPIGQRSDAGASGSGGVTDSRSAATGGSATGGAAEVPEAVDLGDGDQANDGRPVRPPSVAGSAFVWGACGIGGGIGNWWVTSDRQSDALSREIVPPRGASTKARGVTGADFATGVALWVQFDHPSGRPVSFSGCTAMSFWARLESPSGQVVVALNDGSRSSGLLDGRSTLPSKTLDVGPDWQEFMLPFASFPIQGASANSLSLASIEFFVGDGGEKFDLWVDDLALICSGGCP